MYVDYWDLNRANPKDNFPLPHIDVLMDNTASFALFSFMDGFSGYNQIKMAPEGMEKTIEIDVYVDDMIAKSKTEEEHLANLQKLFERLWKYKLRLNPAKCTFEVMSRKLLGFVVSQKGIEVNPEKLTATCKPLFKLLCKDQSVHQNNDCQEAFGRIKQCLMNPPHDDFRKRERAIYYLSKKFTAYEMNYYLLERTCYALVLLSEFDIVYVSQKAIKGSSLADYLAQQPLNDYQPMHPKFPNKDIMALFKENLEDKDKDKWVVWFDGASNALGHRVGAALVSPENQCIPFTARLGFDCTNNTAEYEACSLEIQAAIDFNVKSLKLVEFFDDVSFHHAPREENQMTDALATLALIFQLALHGDLLCIEFRCHGKSTHCYLIEEEQDGKPWYFDIKRCIESKEYPPEASDNDKRMLRRLAAGFFLSGSVLYKRNHEMVLL
ncbi:uncharacterized protein [Glycine max]|uniref:uncharacterized protein n=1 Tax=Glycine max TaxID=3847 RepID=UPI0003DE9937|nr:uncharacterized protein LOC102661755 [Glycine max]|eukprot:XP_006599872.1 uncharacterized protein LOC102661755 [Glycine max]